MSTEKARYVSKSEQKLKLIHLLSDPESVLQDFKISREAIPVPRELEEDWVKYEPSPYYEIHCIIYRPIRKENEADNTGSTK